MRNTQEIRQQVIEALKTVIDPETGIDVYRMKLVLNLEIHHDGTAEYVFRPSSPLCPIALTLTLEIIEAIKSVEGVSDQKITVVDYVGADELNAILATIPLKKQSTDA